jgi:lysophospholipase L1-like esterase
MDRNISKAIVQLTVVVLFFIFADVADAQTVKVACIGDSITALPSSWCGDLATKLGSGYMVMNFGVSGTNLAKNVSQPYWSSAQYTPSHTFAPNIVIIMLGTNDAFDASWTSAKSHFLMDYEELLDTYTSLASKPKPYMIIPTPIGTSPFGHDGKLLETDVIPLIKQVAMEKMVPTIDAFTLFGGAMFDAGLYGGSDQVHPNAKGQQMICDEVYKVLTSTGALGGTASTGGNSGSAGSTNAGSGGMAVAGAGANAGSGGMAMAGGSANTGGTTAGGAGAMNPSAAGAGAANPVGGNAGSRANAAGSMSLAGAPGTATAGSSSSFVNGIGATGAGGAAATGAPAVSAPRSSDGGCRTAGNSASNSGPTAALLLLVGIVIRNRRREQRRR